MRKIILRCMVALLTLMLGVVADSLVSRLFGRDAATIDAIAPIALPYPSAQTPSCFPGLSVDMASLGSHDHYFPPSAFHDVREPFEWYSKYLRAMDQPSYLSLNDTSIEAYRFLWLRSFHHPVAISVSRSGEQYLMTVKELDGAGGYEPGHLMVIRRRPLSESEWSDFSRLLDEACFWSLPTGNESMGEDGAEWILEGVHGGRYHVVDRWTPAIGVYRKACLFLLKISDLGIDEASQDLY